MKRIILACVLMIFLAAPAGAWDIELESEDNLTWEITFTSDEGGNLLGGYFLDFYYDTSELDWKDSTYVQQHPTNTAVWGYIGEYTNTAPSGLYADFLFKPFEYTQDEGSIINFNGTGFSDVTVNGTYSLGIFTFTEASSVIDGVADFQLNLDSTNSGLFISAIDATETPTVLLGDVVSVIANEEGYYKVSTSAVPIPGAVWLMGSAVFGLIGLRRKNKKM